MGGDGRGGKGMGGKGRGGDLRGGDGDGDLRGGDGRLFPNQDYRKWHVPFLPEPPLLHNCRDPPNPEDSLST